MPKKKFNSHMRARFEFKSCHIGDQQRSRGWAEKFSCNVVTYSDYKHKFKQCIELTVTLVSSRKQRHLSMEQVPLGSRGFVPCNGVQAIAVMESSVDFIILEDLVSSVTLQNHCKYCFDKAPQALSSLYVPGYPKTTTGEGNHIPTARRRWNYEILRCFVLICYRNNWS